MRRKPIDKEKPRYLCGSFVPRFFWRKCSKCEFQVKGEKLWCFSIKWQTKYPSKDSYVTIRLESGRITTDRFKFCSTCFSTQEKAIIYFEQELLPLYKELLW